MSSRPTEEEWHANLAKTYGEEKATAIVAALKKAYPQKKRSDAFVYLQRNSGTEWARDAEQCSEDGAIET